MSNPRDGRLDEQNNSCTLSITSGSRVWCIHCQYTTAVLVPRAIPTPNLVVEDCPTCSSCPRMTAWTLEVPQTGRLGSQPRPKPATVEQRRSGYRGGNPWARLISEVSGCPPSRV